MSFWLRELAGWALVLLGLVIFLEVFEFCVARQVIQAGILTVVGIFVFRGGIHLLKVAVAARVCNQIQNRLYPAVAPPPVAARGLRTATNRPAASRGP